MKRDGKPYMPKTRFEGLIEIVRGIFIDRELYRYLTEYFNDREIDSIFRSIRKPTSRYYVRVNTLLVDPYELYRKLKDKGYKVHLDEHIPEALWFEVEGPFKIPSCRKIVVADKYAAESVYVGANLYAPGVVKAKGVKKGDEVTIIAPTGEEVGYGIAQMSEDEIRKSRKGIAVKVLITKYRVPSLRELEEYKGGLIYDQSIAAQWVAKILNPNHSELVVDMNCAPGGKLTHIIQVGRCRVLAFDRSFPKVKDTIDSLNRLKMYNMCDILIHDSRYIDVDFPKIVNKVDKVLIDPPCTSLGVRPKLIEVKTMRDVEVSYRYQLQFLKPAYRLLKRGGKLIYSTCTITVLENEKVVEEALKIGFELEYVDIPYKEIGISGNDWDYMVARFLPHIHDFSPGFFIALLSKK